jgi:hypothetical protein
MIMIGAAVAAAAINSVAVAGIAAADAIDSSDGGR